MDIKTTEQIFLWRGKDAQPPYLKEECKLCGHIREKHPLGEHCTICKREGKSCGGFKGILEEKANQIKRVQWIKVDDLKMELEHIAEIANTDKFCASDIGGMLRKLISSIEDSNKNEGRL